MLNLARRACRGWERLVVVWCNLGLRRRVVGRLGTFVVGAIDDGIGVGVGTLGGEGRYGVWSRTMGTLGTDVRPFFGFGDFA